MMKDIIIFGSIKLSAIHKIEAISLDIETNKIIYLVRCYAREQDPSCHEYQNVTDYQGGNILEEATNHLLGT